MECSHSKKVKKSCWPILSNIVRFHCQFNEIVHNSKILNVMFTVMPNSLRMKFYCQPGHT